MREVNVALIGYAFMGRAHSNAWRQVGRFLSPKLTPRLKVICGRDRANVKRAAAQLGWDEWATDWREVIARPDIDIVDVSTPGDSHAEIAIAAAQAGKAILCEKPLANDVREAKAMWKAVKKAGVAEHALPQLPPDPGGDAGARARGHGQARPHLPLPRHLPAGLVHRSRAAALLALPKGEVGLRLARRHPARTRSTSAAT